MLRIGKLTDYAVQIMSQLAKAKQELMSATLLADKLHLSVPTVSKILKMLAEGSLVTSVRGAEGGYLLAKPAAEISIADVINAMEGGVAMTECCGHASECIISPRCTMQDNWKKINNAVQAMLAQLSIVDMAGPLTLPEHFNGK